METDDCVSKHKIVRVGGDRGGAGKMVVKTRSFLKRFKAYAWETPTHEISSAVGLPESKVYRLDTNTSPFSPVVPLQELRNGLTGGSVNQYPDTSYLNLRRLLSSYAGKAEDR